MVKPAWVRESAFAMECEVYQVIDIPVPNSTPADGSATPPFHSNILQTMFIGLIKMVHVRNAIMRPDSLSVDIERYKPILRIGGPNYARVLEGFNLTTPKWPEVEARYRELELEAAQKDDASKDG